MQWDPEIENQNRIEEAHFTLQCNWNSKIAMKSKIGNYREEAQHFTLLSISDFQFSI